MTSTLAPPDPALAPFLAAVEAELQRRGTVFSRRDLQDFLEAAWPLTDGDAVKWAGAFVEAQRAAGLAG